MSVIKPTRKEIIMNYTELDRHNVCLGWKIILTGKRKEIGNLHERFMYLSLYPEDEYPQIKGDRIALHFGVKHPKRWKGNALTISPLSFTEKQGYDTFYIECIDKLNSVPSIGLVQKILKNWKEVDMKWEKD